MLLTFNFKGIDELTGSPPLLMDSPEEKIFRDVLTEVLDKVNALLPAGSKLTITNVEVSSFDAEPLDFASYSKPVGDVTMLFGSSFVVARKSRLKVTAFGQPGIGIREQTEAPEQPSADLDAGAISKNVIASELSARDKTIGDDQTDEEEIGPEKKVETQQAPDLVSPPTNMSIPSPSTSGQSGPLGAPGGAGVAAAQPSLPITKPSTPAPATPSVPSIGIRSKTEIASSIERVVTKAPDVAPKAVDQEPSHDMPSLPSAGIALPVAAPPEGMRKLEADEKHRDELIDDFSRAAEKKKAKDAKTMPSIEDHRTRAKPPSPARKTVAETLEGGEELASKQQYDKNISVEYFDVMNPENYYPLIVDIADIEQVTKKVEENIITGERKVQKKEKATFETDIITVRPIFPGCSVTPVEMDADLKKAKDVLTFYVTPLVKGEVKGHIQFLAGGKVAHKTDTPAQVKDPRFGKVITLYGVIASMIPKASSLFSIDLGMMLAPLLGLPATENMGNILTSVIAGAGTGIAFLIGLIYAATHKPRSTQTKLHMSDFRLSIIPTGENGSPW
nr:hypothetical protein [Candidatus Sigynarchaeota archaeon]